MQDMMTDGRRNQKHGRANDQRGIASGDRRYGAEPRRAPSKEALVFMLITVNVN